LALKGALVKEAEEFLRQCLADDPDHSDAWWCLAAVLWLRGEKAELARHADGMRPANHADARFHYFAGLSWLAPGDFAKAVASCAQAAAAPAPLQAAAQAPTNGTPTAGGVDWPVEAAYLSGLAHLMAGDRAAAAVALAKAAATEG